MNVPIKGALSLCFGLIMTCFLSPVFGESTYVEVTVSESRILVSPLKESSALFKTSQGNAFLLLGEESDYVNISVLESTGWIPKSDVRVTTKQSHPPVVQRVQLKPELLYSQQGQENYRFPRRDSNRHFDVKIDGFYEAKMSGRNYSPRDRSDKRYQTIINDEAYKKIPRNVLLGPMQIDFRSKIGIEGKLSEDLYVFYDIEQEPDMPNKYDVELKYKDHHLQFFHLNSEYSQGDFINVNKSLRGAQYKYNGENNAFQVSMGKERSNSQVAQGFGTGSNVIKLPNRYIFPGSIRVFVNNVRKSIDSDFSVDYYKGEVYFSDPPQTSDYYKIIYENSNPIADFLPVLARRNYFATQYELSSKTENTIETQTESYEESFELNKGMTDSYSVSLNYGYVESIPSFSKELYEEFLTLLKDEEILVSPSFLSKAYSPTQELTGVFEDTTLEPVAYALKDALDYFYFDSVQAEKKESYLDVQLFPDSLAVIDGIHLQDSIVLFDELRKSRRIDAQGFIRSDIMVLESVLAKSSAYAYFDASILEWMQLYSAEKGSELREKFILAKSPVVLGSEAVVLNGIRLESNRDYVVDHSLGVLTFLTPLTESDSISVDYSYYLTADKSEDLIGKNSIGPYPLLHDYVVENSVLVYLNNTELTEVRDYIVDYNSGEIFFNFDVAYPEIISVKYQHILTKVTEKVSQSQPFDVSVTYMREFIPEEDEETVTTISSENVTVSENSVLLSQSPLTNTENISISVDGVTLGPSDYTVSSVYQSQIEISSSVNATSASSVEVSYQYLNSYRTKYIFLSDGRSTGYNETDETEVVFRELPIKYQGVHYITLWDGASELILEENTDYTVSYEDDGNYVVIRFLVQGYDNDESKLTAYPQSNQRVTVVYDYTPSDTTDIDNVVHQMFGSAVTAHLSDRWTLSGEIAVAGNNVSHKIEEGVLSATSGTGQDNHFYSLGKTNIVEGSEQIFVNGYSQTKDEDYLINYKRGTFRFRNFSPSTDDVIEAFYQNYVSGGTLTAGEEVLSYATKMKTAYTSPDFSFSSAFKYIDKDFDPIGGIQDAKGNTILDNEMKWKISPSTSLDTSYSRHRELKEENQIGESIYLHKDILNAKVNQSFSDYFNVSQAFRYQQDLQDADQAFEGDYTRDVDDLTYSYNGALNFGPDYLKSKVSQGMSRQLTDYRDRLDFKETRTKVSSYQTDFKKPKFGFLGATTFSPSYYNSYSENSSEKDSGFSFNRREEYKVNAAIAPISQLQLSTNGSFSEVTNQSSSTTSPNVNQSKGYSVSSSFTPISWFGTNFSYGHSEKMSPLLGQQSDVTDRLSANLRRFSPYHMLRALGLGKQHYLSNALKKTNINYSYSESASKTNNRRKHQQSLSERWGLSSIQFLKTLSVSNLSYVKSSSQNDNYIEQALVSENHSISDRVNYGGKLSYSPQFLFLKYFKYNYSLSESLSDVNQYSLAHAVSGNRTLQENFERKVGHSASFNSPQLAIVNPFNRAKLIRFGRLSLNFAQKKDRVVNTKSTRYLVYNPSTFGHDEEPAHTESIDTTITEKTDVKGSISPFNIITVAGNYSQGTNYLNRNKYNATGTTFQDTNGYGLSTSVSPFAFISIKGSYKQSRYTQYLSPSLNMTVDDLFDAFEARADNLTSYIQNLSESYSSSLTLRPFRILSITGSGTVTLKEENKITPSDSSTKTFETISYTTGLGFFPMKDLSINFSYSFNQINKGSKGQNNNLTVQYTPVKRTYSSIAVSYTRTQSVGFGFNTIQQSNSTQGSGNYIETEVVTRNDVVQKGSVDVTVSYPIQSPYIQKFEIIAEGYIKIVTDVLDDSDNDTSNDNSYDISGLIMKGTLHF